MLAMVTTKEQETLMMAVREAQGRNKKRFVEKQERMVLEDWPTVKER